MTDDEILKLSYSENKYLTNPSQKKEKEFEEGFLIGYKTIHKYLKDIVEDALQFGFKRGEKREFSKEQFDYFIEYIEKTYKIKL